MSEFQDCDSAFCKYYMQEMTYQLDLPILTNPTYSFFGSAPTVQLPKDKPTESGLAKARVIRAKADAAKEKLIRERLLSAAARANLPTAPITPEKVGFLYESNFLNARRYCQ